MQSAGTVLGVLREHGRRGLPPEEPSRPGTVAGRENGHTYSPGTLCEAVARGGGTAGHVRATCDYAGREAG